MCKSWGIYGFLGPSWVLITMAPRNTWNEYFFPIRFIVFAPCFSLPPVLSYLKSWGHIAGPFFPLPTTVRAFNFFPEKTLALSLVGSRRMAPTHARRSQQLLF